jgi:hypothetical protein
MKIVQTFESLFLAEIENKTPIEILNLLNDRGVLNMSNMERYVIRKEFNDLCDARGGFCHECYQKIPDGVVPILADKFGKEPRQIHYIVKGK